MTGFLQRLRVMEPAAVAEAVRAVIVALVTLGWVTLDNAAIATLASAIGFVVSLALSLLVRQKVVPEAKLLDGAYQVTSKPKHALGSDQFRARNPLFDPDDREG